jgi:DnaK suppressor protein
MRDRSIRKGLESERRVISGRILLSVQGRREQLDDRREMSKDPFGSASLTLDDEITLAVVEQRARILDQLNSALDDIDDGVYGLCRDCQRPIPDVRLAVVPFATRCVPCQTAYERRTPEEELDEDADD